MGGFNGDYYALEDLVFVKALKRQGRFVIPAETVVTSGRKLRAHSLWSFCSLSRAWFFAVPVGFAVVKDWIIGINLNERTKSEL
jgi:hypothetical protein